MSKPHDPYPEAKSAREWLELWGADNPENEYACIPMRFVMHTDDSSCKSLEPWTVEEIAAYTK